MFQFSQVGKAGQVFGGLELCLWGKAGCDLEFYNDDGIDGGVGWPLPIPLLRDQFIIKMPTLQELQERRSHNPSRCVSVRVTHQTLPLHKISDRFVESI
ncbi:hypothetical protein H6F89_28200 [Cyanobacteria bacterium FACHB-63]|nr:hypothetical protein [Cyanobacteria bacterium FACHB-63]